MFTLMEDWPVAVLEVVEAAPDPAAVVVALAAAVVDGTEMLGTAVAAMDETPFVEMSGSTLA